MIKIFLHIVVLNLLTRFIFCNAPNYDYLNDNSQVMPQSKPVLPVIPRTPYSGYYPSWMTNFMGYQVPVQIPYSPQALSVQKRLVLPTVKLQDDNWSCGINSATRVLKYYGHQVNYDALREIRKSKFQVPLIKRLSFARKPTPLYKLGTRPGGVVELLKIHRRNSYSQIGTTLERIKQLIRLNRPVIALIKPANQTVKLPFGKSVSLPALHWIVVSGYDDNLKRIYYYDTIANEERYYSETKFMERWNWNHKLIKHALQFKPRTIVY